MSGYVYAIQSGDAVKIGWSAQPHNRNTKVNSDNVQECTIIGVVPATMAQEGELHRLLEPWRIRKEWFRREGAVLDFLAMLSPPARAITRKRPRDDAHPLTHWRAANGITGGQFAAMCGVSQAHISRLEARKNTASLSLALAIQRATDGAVPVEALIATAEAA